MKIRTQLLLACFLLAVLPLTGVVFYSYRSSRTALEDAYHREARRLTTQMDRRLTSIRADLDQRLAGLSAIPLSAMKSGTKGAGSPSREGMVDSILMAMGEAAPLVDALEYVPVAMPAPPAPPPQPGHVVAPHVHPVPVAPQVAATVPTPAVPKAQPSDESDFADGETGTGTDPGLNESIVIDLPPVKYPRFTMPPDFNERVAEINNLSTRLSDQSLTPEARAAIKAVIKEKQLLLKRELDAIRETFHAEMDNAHQRRADRERVIQQRREAEMNKREAERERQRIGHEPSRTTEAHPPTPPAPAPKPVAQVVRVQMLTPSQRQLLKDKEKQASLLFGRRFNVPLHSEGEVVGQLRAQVSTEEVVKRVLGSPDEDTGEIPFAVDREGTVYTRDTTERATLDRLGIVDALKSRRPLPNIPNWIVAMSLHKDSGLRIGVASPVGENLEELRNTAARNFGWGVGVIALALIGILPVAGHFASDVRVVTDGADRIAHGDLTTRLPVRSKNEFGQLALAFNRMAEDLSHQQEKIVEQERAQREQDVQQRILALEYQRKSVELEEARRFQLSMLPKQVPQHESYDIAVLTQTAAEVGGDYYDFHLSPGGVVSVTIGDATGHGAKAGTMVTVVKTLFSGYSASIEPAAFLGEAAEKIKRMELGRMAMALALARFDGHQLTIATAGMPPVLIHRSEDGRVDEFTVGATPLGTLGIDYEQTNVTIARGDTVLLMSDGFPELENTAGQQLGYVRATQEFAAAATADGAAGVIANLQHAAKRWHGDQPPNDDVTFVVVRCTA